MRTFRVAVLLLAGSFAATGQAFGQERYRGTDPNVNHFFMARQQIQILDDSPSVNDMRTNPQAAAAGKGQPAPMNKPQALPRAGFMPYSGNQPSMRSSLPTTFNGVPQKLPPAPPPVNPKNAKAGKYSKNKPASTPSLAASQPQTAKMYAPVKGYGSGIPTMRPVTVSAGGDASTRVQGSLLNKGPAALHWSRTRQ